MSLAARSVPFSGKPMKQVRRSDVETWIKIMDAAGLAPRTIKTRFFVASGSSVGDRTDTPPEHRVEARSLEYFGFCAD